MIALWKINALSEKEAAAARDLDPRSRMHDQDELVTVERPSEVNDKFARLAEELEKGNVPLLFFGVVRDENDAPLSGVVVKYRVQAAGTVSENGKILVNNPTGVIATNARGEFQIVNQSGKSLIIESLVKEGYSMDADQALVFGYVGTPEIHLPDAANPHSLVMVRNDSKTDLSKTRIKLVLPWDGEPVRVDMESGKISKSGDLIVTAYREPEKAKFEWWVMLSIQGGRIQAAQKGKGFVAPSSGYQASWKCGFPSQKGEWRFGYDEQLFYKKADFYGRLALQIYADAPPGSVSVYINRYLNQNGGRFTGE